MDFLSSLLLFRAFSQEACAFVFDQALFDNEEVEVLSIPADGFYEWKRQRNQEVPCGSADGKFFLSDTDFGFR